LRNRTATCSGEQARRGTGLSEGELSFGLGPQPQLYKPADEFGAAGEVGLLAAPVVYRLH
jgi:hypothetical protein